MALATLVIKIEAFVEIEVTRIAAIGRIVTKRQNIASTMGTK